jgi:hypothetical protein
LTVAGRAVGSSKRLVLLDRIDVHVSAPPHITQTKPGLNDGIGDMTFLFKYRAAAGNPEQGNYVVTAVLAAPVPQAHMRTARPTRR